MATIKEHDCDLLLQRAKQDIRYVLIQAVDAHETDETYQLLCDAFITVSTIQREFHDKLERKTSDVRPDSNS